jgi:hypothetical protein
MICISMMGLFGAGALVFSDSPQVKGNVLTAFAEAAFTYMLIVWVWRKYRPPGKL